MTDRDIGLARAAASRSHVKYGERCESCGVLLGLGWHYAGCEVCGLGLNGLSCTLPRLHPGPHSWEVE